MVGGVEALSPECARPFVPGVRTTGLFVSTLKEEGILQGINHNTASEISSAAPVVEDDVLHAIGSGIFGASLNVHEVLICDDDD